LTPPQLIRLVVPLNEPLVSLLGCPAHIWRTRLCRTISWSGSEFGWFGFVQPDTNAYKRASSSSRTQKHLDLATIQYPISLCKHI